MLDELAPLLASVSPPARAAVSRVLDDPILKWAEDVRAMAPQDAVQVVDFLQALLYLAEDRGEFATAREAERRLGALLAE